MRDANKDCTRKGDVLQSKCIHLQEPDDCGYCLHTTRMRMLRLLLGICITIIVFGIVAFYMMG